MNTYKLNTNTNTNETKTKGGSSYLKERGRRQYRRKNAGKKEEDKTMAYGLGMMTRMVGQWLAMMAQ